MESLSVRQQIPTTSNPWSMAACLIFSDKDKAIHRGSGRGGRRLRDVKVTSIFMAWLRFVSRISRAIEVNDELCGAVVRRAGATRSGDGGVPISFVRIELTLCSSTLRNIGPWLVISWDSGGGTAIRNRHCTASALLSFHHTDGA